MLHRGRMDSARTYSLHAASFICGALHARAPGACTKMHKLARAHEKARVKRRWKVRGETGAAGLAKSKKGVFEEESEKLW